MSIALLLLMFYFEATSQSLYIHVKSTKGKQKWCAIYTTKCRNWRYLDFASCAVFVVANICRVENSGHVVHIEMIPWVTHESSYTKEFGQ